jgi:hypothetical protein
MRSAELAAEVVGAALRDNRFEASRFRRYERRVFRAMRPLFKFIHRYYEPAFLEIFLRPRDRFGMLEAVTGVLAGGSFQGLSWRRRLSLNLFFALAGTNYWIRRLRGRPVESRLEW